MADKTIGSLPQAADVGDDSLFVLEQQGTAMKASGAQWKGYAQQAVSQYVSEAQEAAEQAAQSAQSASESLENIGGSVEQAQQAAEAAQATQEAVENLGVSGETLAAGQPVEVVKTVSETGVVTLTFRIPQGTQGEQGIQGETGATGPQGVSITGATVDSSGNLILTLSNQQTVNAGYVIGPVGPQGETGPGVGSIQKTSGTGAAGTTDTYTVYDENGTPIGTFQVYNGANGTGSGDFMANGSVPMTGTLQMGGNPVANVGAPTAPTDAARLEDAQSLTITAHLPASGWQNGSQTVSDASILEGDYSYIVTLFNADGTPYAGVVIYGSSLSAGSMTFTTAESPTDDLTVSILRVPDSNGGHIYNMGAGGGSGIPLQSIAITTPATKTVYTAGESFDPTGMVVTATYQAGITQEVTEYTITPSGPLDYGTTEVTISYSEGGITRTATQAITVNQATGVITADPASVTLNKDNPTQQITVSSNSGAPVSAVSNNTELVTVTVSGGIVTVNNVGEATGATTITLSCEATNNYTAATLEIPVTAQFTQAVPSLPVQDGTLTYTGSVQSPAWTGYDPSQLTLSGQTSGTDAGTYTVTFTPAEGWTWWDGTTEGKTATWAIGKAAGSVSVEPSELTVEQGKSATIEVTRLGDGAISAVSDSDTVTTSVDGTTVTVEAQAGGGSSTLYGKANGSVVTVNENGSPVNFYVATHDYESERNGSGGVLLVREAIPELRVWDAGNSNVFSGSDLLSWMKNVYKQTIDENIQNLIKNTYLRVTAGSGTESRPLAWAQTKIFPLSLTEYGLSNAYANIEGAALPIADTLRIANYNGSPTTHWTRTPVINTDTDVFALNPSGGFNLIDSNLSSGARPAFVLPGNAIVDENNHITGELLSTSATITISVAEGTNYTAPADVEVPVTVTEPSVHVYGAEWDGTASTVWSRTDDAALFTDPSPAVNNGTGSSPFDDLMPWSGMETVEDSVGGTLVSIPKYWYKWTRSGNTMKLQIADGPVDGFLVSPAHADRGDGQGERDVVYVGRYHCSSAYKSQTGQMPLGSITRAAARSSISALGAEYWQYDYAMYWTIMMLYLVEYANWNSQATIGYGCSPSGSKFNMGATDNMVYHTGTSAASRDTYGCCQYRHIEGLWDNVCDWCDGIRFSGSTVYCIANPSSFSDTSGGTNVGTMATTDGWISRWTNPTADGFEYALFPNAVSGSETTYVCDFCYHGPSGVVFCVGGNYDQSQNYGAFYMLCNIADWSAVAYTGCRSMKLPNS